MLGFPLVGLRSKTSLVENSVKYAVSPRREGAEIRVCARAAGDQVTLEVSDDGPGFERGQMQAGHGLDLVESRLAAIFGNEAGLQIASSNGWSTVSLQVPQKVPVR
jgi:LytS/YehU family sensor histidine kinase